MSPLTAALHTLFLNESFMFQFGGGQRLKQPQDSSYETQSRTKESVRAFLFLRLSQNKTNSTDELNQTQRDLCRNMKLVVVEIHRRRSSPPHHLLKHISLRHLPTSARHKQLQKKVQALSVTQEEIDRDIDPLYIAQTPSEIEVNTFDLQKGARWDLDRLKVSIETRVHRTHRAEILKTERKKKDKICG